VDMFTKKDVVGAKVKKQNQNQEQKSLGGPEY